MHATSAALARFIALVPQGRSPLLHLGELDATRAMVSDHVARLIYELLPEFLKNFVEALVLLRTHELVQALVLQRQLLKLSKIHIGLELVLSQGGTGAFRSFGPPGFASIALLVLQVLKYIVLIPQKANPNVFRRFILQLL